MFMYLMFNYDICGVKDGFGWNVCMWSIRLVVDLSSFWKIYNIGLNCLISSILILMSLVWLLAKFGTRSDLVKPTDHARFSVEILHLFWKFTNYFHKKIKGVNGGLFLLFISCCETFF